MSIANDNEAVNGVGDQIEGRDWFWSDYVTQRPMTKGENAFFSFGKIPIKSRKPSISIGKEFQIGDRRIALSSPFVPPGHGVGDYFNDDYQVMKPFGGIEGVSGWFDGIANAFESFSSSGFGNFIGKLGLDIGKTVAVMEISKALAPSPEKPQQQAPSGGQYLSYNDLVAANTGLSPVQTAQVSNPSHGASGSWDVAPLSAGVDPNTNQIQTYLPWVIGAIVLYAVIKK